MQQQRENPEIKVIVQIKNAKNIKASAFCIEKNYFKYLESAFYFIFMLSYVHMCNF